MLGQLASIVEPVTALSLSNNDGDSSLTADVVSEDRIPPYAILSHTWGADAEEVTFEDSATGDGKAKPGYKKIHLCREQALRDGLQYFWIDTSRCYVYLSDVSSPLTRSDELFHPPLWESNFRKSRWFTRGWTLRELLAPRSVEFFSRKQKKLGHKTSLTQLIHKITGIPHLALQGVPLSQTPETKHEEDEAYSLLGIFDISLAPVYGEGAAAWAGYANDPI
ncbi:hypothetical protein BKA66DRAFT_516949 [Pyrenochaeta sp. MPI-SDFR-AT-0127]|nr:hypothetical protein BKA66DRAFT_516949 [Pyrenochaeta sp. MPI-SDFR-AT-0127]